MNDVNLKDLFMTGSRGNVNGFLKEDVFKENLLHEGIWLKTKELDALLNHFYDPKSDCIDCRQIIRSLEVPLKSSLKETSKDWEGRQTLLSEKLEFRKVRKMLNENKTIEKFITKLFDKDTH